MKECPVCKAGSFDDAEVCYGCLHRFEPGEGVVAAIAGGPDGDGPGLAAARAVRPAQPGAQLSVGDGRLAALAASPQGSQPFATRPPMSATHDAQSQSAASQVMEVPALAVAKPYASQRPSSGHHVELGSTEGLAAQTVSVPAKGADIVVRIELFDARAVESTGSARVDAALQARACSRLRRGGTPGARLEVKYPSESERGAAASARVDAASRDSRSRHARPAAPRHAQAVAHEACAVGA
jgi:hypothetical protein